MGLGEEFFMVLDHMDNTAVLSICGELDMLTGPRVVAQCVRISEGSHKGLVIDATDLTFIDASGIRALLEGRDALCQKGCSFGLVPSSHVRRLIDLLRLDEILAMHSSVTEALRQLGHQDTGYSDVTS